MVENIKNSLQENCIVELKGKTILIISPQAWGGLYISKHHYAIELASRGNQVYFLYRGNKLDGSVEYKESGVVGVNFLVFNEFVSHRLRFHFRFAYDFLIKKIITKRIVDLIDNRIDIVWSFDFSIFKNLKWFDASFYIFHPVDKVRTKEQFQIANSANIIFSVAGNILDQFKKINVPQKLINHGLSPYFYPSCKINEQKYVKPNRLKFAYIGNLTIPIIDHRSILNIIKQHQEIDFYFYGKNEVSPNNKKVNDFLLNLKKAKNVFLKGIYHPRELRNELEMFDGFLLCYLPSVDPNNGSNTHKMLEYLSLGKVIVSSYVEHYCKYDDIIQMSKKEDNSDFVELFNNVVQQLNLHNELEMRNARQLLAYGNTYSKQVDKIEYYLNKFIR